jgi:hypothetical protein
MRNILKSVEGNMFHPPFTTDKNSRVTKEPKGEWYSH